MEKKAFVSKELIESIVKDYPTPFHIYDEKGIRENAMALKAAFAWNKGYKEFFAVKATPNPFLMRILKECGCGCDCSSYTELMLSDAVGVRGEDIMFSSNDTPAEEFALAEKLGATINLDDITHICFLEQVLGYLPKPCGVLAKEELASLPLTEEVLDISESTLYPVLRRLQAEGCLSAYNRAYRNRNRRYYAITEAGRVRLAENRALWRAYCEGVDWLLREEAKDGEA